ncbi:hypothetical protein [Spiroplasma poulsonii]|uniref:hypothetical protein n=1 Tax=Spiroplasma poulsonii TaxID=2138 RepID=UPI001F4CF8A7|nr:hypothetical protein [Spiroplasma poulsonii]UNF61957.1 hypothetical protein MNU24_00355 [Spiroplasma poulsonii]
MIILMIKLLLLIPKLQSNAQKRQNNLILVKRKHTIKTSNYRTRNQKIIATSFSPRKKHDYALFKEQNPNFKKIPN